MDELIENVLDWADERGLLERENRSIQMLKVMEEIGETAGALAKNNPDEIKDGIGDSLATLIILAHQCGFTTQECLVTAWEEIKGRTGKTIQGVFVKDS
jgi:NTP pyrophosphatase (non-canonical NTP hydrolase)